MDVKKNSYTFKSLLSGIWQNFIHELKTTFTDRGVVILLIVGPFIYPLLYGVMYLNETLVDVPVGIVDNSQSMLSHQIARNLDATEALKVYSNYSSMSEARQAFNNREIHGIVFIPRDLNRKISMNEQAVVSVYSDISSFMYYRSIYQSTTYSLLSLSKNIQVQRLNSKGITGESALMVADPLRYQNISLYNAGVGFASFLLPAIMILILFQTMFFGITMLAGTSREENRFHVLVSPDINREGILRIITGKAFLYFLIYFMWIFYALGLIPLIFNLPHIGNMIDIVMFMTPFLLASIFFAMSVSVFIPNRETSMVLFMFFSIILLFLSGITWPQSNINGFWKIFAWLFPSTQGVQGYIKINTMGASLHQVRFEYVSLWIQTALYFITTFWTYRWQIKKSFRTNPELSETADLQTTD